MKRYGSREVNVFSMSAIDLFCSAMGAMLILSVIMIPSYKKNARLSDVELVFVIDTTGSMEDQISDLQSSLRAVVTALHRMSQNLRIGVVAFKDRDSASEHYLTLEHPLSDVHREKIDEGRSFERLAAFIKGLSAKGGGGSGPNGIREDVMAGLDSAFGMDWRGDDEALRIIMLIGDAAPQAENEEEVISKIERWAKGGENRRFMAVFTSVEPARLKSFKPVFERMAAAAGSQGRFSTNSGELMGDILDAVVIE